MKNQSGFGIVLIESGSEVASRGKKLDIHRIGTYSYVVDWNQLPSGLLGITAEGNKTFRIVESWQQDDGLCMAEVKFREHDGVDAEPVEVGDEFQEYVDLLMGLTRHPAIEELKLKIHFENLQEVAWRLSELLPISNREKQALLEMDNPFERLEQIDLYITALNQQQQEPSN